MCMYEKMSPINLSVNVFVSLGAHVQKKCHQFVCFSFVKQTMEMIILISLGTQLI